MDWSEKLKAVLVEMNIKQRALAEMTDVNPPYISEILKGKNKNPSLRFIQSLIDIGVSPNFIYNETLPVLSFATKRKPKFILELQTKNNFNLRNEIELFCRTSDIYAVRVVGDAMTPTLKSGDYAIISKDFAENDGIYAINEGGSISIRRLQFLRQEDAVLVISDNVQYQPRRLPLSKIRDYLTIEGRVVCRVLFE